MGRLIQSAFEENGNGVGPLDRNVFLSQQHQAARSSDRESVGVAKRVWDEGRISHSLVSISVLKLSNIIMACAAASSRRLCRHSFIFIVPQLIHVPHCSKKAKHEDAGSPRDPGCPCRDVSVGYLYLLIFNCYLLNKKKQASEQTNNPPLPLHCLFL